MKLLYVCRLMSGFADGLARGEWAPRGSPTVYKMIEHLDRGPDEVRFVFTAKGGEAASPFPSARDRVVTPRGLGNAVTVLAGEGRFPWVPGRLRGHLSEARQVLRLVRAARGLAPDLVYVDRANVLAGAVLARFFRVPVMLRLMGVTPAMHAAVGGRRPFERLLRWAYRSPFALVLASQDGSGAEAWLSRALAPEVERTVLVNGVGLPPPASPPHPALGGLPRDRMIVLFVGRIEALKGCDEFVDAVLALKGTHRGRVHAVVVGDGDRLRPLQARVAEAGASDMVTFTGALPHPRVAEALARADVYVSLNRQGNLSNANLEAMTHGVCTVIPESDPETGIDLATDRLLPPGTVIRIPREGQVRALAGVLARLADRPDERRALAEAVARRARRFVPTWDERIARECALLARVARGSGAAGQAARSPGR